MPVSNEMIPTSDLSPPAIATRYGLGTTGAVR
jgi:hypothetical protein